MSWGWRLLLLGLVGSATLLGADTGPLARSTSASRQFIVETNDPKLSATIALYADRLKSALLAKLQLRDTWQSRVFITVAERKDNHDDGAIYVSATAIGGKLQFLIRVQTPPPLNQADFFRALSQILCIELINRPLGNVSTGDTLTVMPLWLSEGFWQSVAESSVQVSVQETNLILLQRAANAGQLWTWEKIGSSRCLPSDAVELQLFSAQAQTLVESLLLLPDGVRKMQRFLGSLAAAHDWKEAFLGAYGHDLADDAAVRKWLSLRLQARAQQRIAQALSAPATERRLEEILPTTIFVKDGRTGAQEAKTLRLAELAPYRQLAGLDENLDGKLAALVALQASAHPVYRDTIAEYVEAVRNLRQQRFRNFSWRVKRAESLHEKASRQARDIGDYLTALEGQTPGLAASLRSYFLSVDEAPKSSPNSIRGYLDRIEQEPKP